MRTERTVYLNDEDISILHKAAVLLDAIGGGSKKWTPKSIYEMCIITERDLEFHDNSIHILWEKAEEKEQ